MQGPAPMPEDWCRHQRLVIPKLMRLAFEEEAHYLLEDLEKQREHVDAQLAYVLANSEPKHATLRCKKQGIQPGRGNLGGSLDPP